MQGALYLTDAYRREFDSQVRAVRNGAVLLGTTAFYPTGGGQPSDSGRLEGAGDRVWNVRAVEKSSEGILHLVDGRDVPEVDSPIHGQIDWERRYRHMRYHTALHILSGATYRKFGAGITGGQIYEDRARMDFPLTEFDRTVAEDLLRSVNEVVREARPVRVRTVPRDALEGDPGLVRVAKDLLPDVQEVRLIDIEGFDVQADGGTHVASTAEVGPVRLERIENKGSRNKRLYIRCEEPPRPETR